LLLFSCIPGFLIVVSFIAINTNLLRKRQVMRKKLAKRQCTPTYTIHDKLAMHNKNKEKLL